MAVPKAAAADWHRWFAWRPVVDQWAPGKATKLWLETIERRWCTVTSKAGGVTVGYWQYRPITSTVG